MFGAVHPNQYAIKYGVEKKRNLTQQICFWQMNYSLWETLSSTGVTETKQTNERFVESFWIIYVASVFFLLCFRALLFIDALWSPVGKGLTSWLSFVMSNCKVFTFPLVSCARCGARLCRFLIFALLLTMRTCTWCNVLSSVTFTPTISEGRKMYCVLHRALHPWLLEGVHWTVNQVRPIWQLVRNRIKDIAYNSKRPSIRNSPAVKSFLTYHTGNDTAYHCARNLMPYTNRQDSSWSATPSSWRLVGHGRLARTLPAQNIPQMFNWWEV